MGAEEPEIIVTAPNGGEEWEALTDEYITWTSPLSIEFVDISYSKDDFVSDINIIDTDVPNTGSYQWNLPDDPSDHVLVKVANSSGPEEDTSDDYFTILEGQCNFGTTGFNLANNHGSISLAWTYVGIIASQQDPIQRIFAVSSGSHHNINVYNGSDPTSGIVDSYNTGDLIYCNNNQAMWIDPYSEPGIDRIFYVNFGGGSPTPGYKLQMIDWDGSGFVNYQLLSKPGSVWNACFKPNGDLIIHNANSLTPRFYLFDKSNGYSYSVIFTLNQANIPIGSVSRIKVIRYNPVLDAIFLLVDNGSISDTAQLYAVDMSGNVLAQDQDVFTGVTYPLEYNFGLSVDLNSPDCRVVAYASGDSGQYYGLIARYSANMNEKEVNEYPGMSYGPARGDLGSNGVLWAAPVNGIGYFQEWAPPPDW